MPNFIYFLFICFLVMTAFVILVKALTKESAQWKKYRGVLYVMVGMILGLIVGVVTFLSIIPSKGNDFERYWFLATFGATIIGGLIGIFVFGYRTKKSE